MAADKVADLVQLDRRTTTNGTAGKRGSGLGLLLCRNLVERQGRTLTVEGVPSRGTTFDFILPRPRWSGGSASHCSGPEPAWRITGAGARLTAPSPGLAHADANGHFHRCSGGSGEASTRRHRLPDVVHRHQDQVGAPQRCGRRG
ncbi:ATP-binding protein [Methylobacterium sp. J-059]|nr:ATP-binding protein [Methylobacterium sp. J-059]